MNLNDALRLKSIDPRNVLVLRHRPHEPQLRRVLPWLASEKPDFFNAYQQTQGGRLEQVMQKMVGEGYVASFVGCEPGKALFIGLYAIKASKPLTFKQFWQVPAYKAMKSFGMKGWHTQEAARPAVLWFDLEPLDFYAHWKGKLVIAWPPPERSWWRRAHRKGMDVLSILDESVLVPPMPEWDTINLSWEELQEIPERWKSSLREWRGIYYIFDTSDGKGYVGSAYGATNILGRWKGYAASGHGGNRLLKRRDPKQFRFSILQRLAPDLGQADVIRIENSWKERLHTRVPFGLNDN